MLRLTKLQLFNILLFTNSGPHKCITIRANNELRNTVVDVTKKISPVLNPIREKRVVTLL